ncbi:PD-(D/E)XK nuclease family protein [Bifidobacterium avesanii]|uniref:UvrD-like helicase ATP-binding domain-containing protein n=1 Tax=Bifidobacterium avesanii TaxID=1798157 RepID=A0A7K3TIN3_9BIFI|nr:PD-(D/E)XK nuclease family protein [Bifidobacterium avesanii]KAB8292638.1 PD-(D/E)XK nuclease superfamily [Bifidobacterium avesanii]NEG78534.1 hypothetical protein [Bifidobacterium avesanii]
MTNADVKLAVGTPNGGKTEYALRALLEGIREFGADRALMAVSGRKAADALADRVIREIGSSTETRPVTTLSAIAFRLIDAVRRRDGESAPRLLNGAEQDALLRRVMAVHLRHAAAGETGDCATCGMIAAYFASERWEAMVLRPDAEPASTAAADKLFERGIGDAFVDQLRDMLARMNELGASNAQEGRIIAAIASDGENGDGSQSPADVLRRDRLRVQWRLAFALRREYVRAIETNYPGEYRLDPSRLLVEGVDAVCRAHPDDLPQLVVVDDVQDLTLAGLAFLEALRDAGCALTLVGNPDESVQSFRGSYPEYVFARIRGWRDVTEIRLPGEDGTGADAAASPAPRNLDLAAARVSLAILSLEDDPLPVAQRPGKLPAWPGALPVAPQEGMREPNGDGSLMTALYRSPREEIDDVTWRIRHEHLRAGREWNDMAVIAHDNATVRRIGERLRREGVPVLYSSVTRPLKDEPFVAGLFAIVELARLKRRGLADCGMPLREAAAYVRSRVAAVMNGPLVAVGASDRSEGYPARLNVAESAMDSLQSLAGVVGDAGRDGKPGGSADEGGSVGDLPRLMAQWERFRDRAMPAAEPAEPGRAADAPGVAVDDEAFTGAAIGDAEPPEFGRDALYLMLAFGGEDDSESVLRAVHAVCGSTPAHADGHAEAFGRVWRIVDGTAQAIGGLRNREAQYVLSAAWKACGVARDWQRLALANSEAGRAANDRLDVAMRLFQFAADTTADRDVEGFIAQVRAMQVEADSLAHVAPVEQAVTLTTPAGAAGRHWDLVWMPAVQQDVWPNLASRNTMFGGEDLADVMLRGRLADADDMAATGVRSPRLASVLYAEMKSLLVALTRARVTAYVSAAMSDELAPSDFLYGFLPERYPRGGKPTYTEVGGGGEYAGLETDPRGLVAAARMTLARAAMDGTLDGGRARDAADALALLAAHGVESADPDRWAFVPRKGETGNVEAMASERPVAEPPAASETSNPNAELRPNRDRETPRVVSLSPSAVDGLWACPVCWLLENRFAGPRRGGAAASFGTIMHAVAEQASREGLDMPDRGLDADAIAARMGEIYASLRPDADAIDDVRERYAAARRDADAAGMIANMAAYFADSNAPDYPPKNAANMTVGRLEGADCELEFAARFGFDDILAAYNAIDGMTPIDPPTLKGIMGALVGGWPEALRGDRDAGDLTVRLSGRIDRAETRTLPDGSAQLRLIDYKTGRKPGMPQLFGDLQLVCYQLGVMFPEGGPGGLEALRRAPAIAQAALFHVAADPYPATSYGAESAYQPPLFAHGSLNAEPFAPRYYFKGPQRLFDSAGVLPAEPPEGVAPDDWERFAALRGTQAVWALTMVSRVFYAAGASVSARIVAHPQPDHVRHCRCLGVCPACSGQIDTVFETRQA